MDRQTATRVAGEGLAHRTDRQVGSTLDAHRVLHLAKAHGLRRQLLNPLFEPSSPQPRPSSSQTPSPASPWWPDRRPRGGEGAGLLQATRAEASWCPSVFGRRTVTPTGGCR
ncbi:hypothetical protein [Streptomyces xinghaiensis]|uniref:hypothetical protein n=1 Tax=Streptomyces xinghaiensis TaxID=1038928 RepID=UPI00344A4E31